MLTYAAVQIVRNAGVKTAIRTFKNINSPVHVLSMRGLTKRAQQAPYDIMPTPPLQSQNQPKIWFAIKSLSAAAGGAEKVLCDLANGLIKCGFNVQILTFDHPGTPSFYPLNPEIVRLDLGIGNTSQKSTGKELWQRMRLLRQIALKERPDIIIGFMHSMFVPMSIALMGTNIPVIASEHTIPAHYKQKPLELLTIFLSFRFFKIMVVVSEQVRSLYPAALQSRIQVIPNPLMLKKPLEVPPKENLILNVGRLEKSKDQETVIRAFAKLAQAYPDWNLKIIGDGSLKDELKNLVRTLDLQDRIVMPGNLPDLSEDYSRASLFVTASRYESLGMATLEALGYGLPAIGFADCPGTNKIIQDGQNGFLVSSSDRISNLAEAMKSLMDSKDRLEKFSKSAIQSVQTYCAQDVYQRWRDLIFNICTM